MLLSLSGSVARDRSGLIKLTAMSHKSDLNFPVNKIRKYTQPTQHSLTADG